MKIVDLDGQDIKLSDIKVKLPENIREAANEFYDEIPEEVWLVGPMMGDWFVKINHDDSRVFPLFLSYIPYEEISEWEVVEIFNH